LARQAAIDGEINLALTEAATAYEGGKLPQARAAVRRAEALLASGQAPAELRRAVCLWRADLDLVARVEEIPVDSAVPPDGASEPRSAIAAYREAFGEYGLDPATTDVLEAAARLRSRPQAVRAALIGALDDWEARIPRLLGITLELKEGMPVVGEVRPDSAATEDGRLKAGDRLLGVGEGETGPLVAVRGLALQDILARLKGEHGTAVRL
jgi:hypothetical protein